MLKMFIFPFLRLLLPEPFWGFMMPHTVIGIRLYTTVFLANYAPKEEEFERNALQTVVLSNDDRTLHR